MVTLYSSENEDITFLYVIKLTQRKSINIIFKVVNRFETPTGY